MRQSEDDYLRPPSGIFDLDEEYLQFPVAVCQQLLKDAHGPEMARLLCFYPFGRPEWWVRVREVERNAGDYEIQTGKGSKPLLFERQRGSRATIGINKISVRRQSAPIDRTTAEQIASVWQQAIRAARYPQPPPLPKGTIRIRFDGIRYVLDCIDKTPAEVGLSYIAGETISPERGSICYELTEIATRLFDYAEAPSEKRDSLLPEIRKRLSDVAARQQRLARS